MELIADRFVALAAECIFDLATGERVFLKRLGAAGPEEEVRWASGCAARTRWDDPQFAKLLDFGTTGDGLRFEAWTAGKPVLPEREEPDEGRHHDAELAAIADAIDSECGVRPRALAIYSRDAGARSALLLDAARHARRRGFVPVASSFVAQWTRLEGIAAGALDPLLAGRSLFVIHDGTRGTLGEALAAAVLRAPRPHVVVCAGPTCVAGIDTIVLRSAAGGSCARSRPLRAAEQPVPYAAAASSAALVPTSSAPRTSADLAAWRRRVAAAQALLAQGRCASGERLLRRAIGGLNRRGDWATAGEGLNTLAQVLLVRGRPRDALAELERARDVLGRAHDEPRLIDATILAGRARLQLAATQEAESTLAAAVTASRGAGDRVRATHAAAALALCLAWQGRYEEARDTAESCAQIEQADVRAERASATVMALVGLGRSGEALAAALAWAPGATDDQHAAAHAAALAAFGHLAVGDLDAVQRDLAGAIPVAISRGDRVLAVHCRLMAAEAARRSNRRDVAAGLVRRLARVGEAALPPLVHARVRLLGDLLTDEAVPHTVAARHARATGLAALQLFVPPPASVEPGRRAIADFVEILEACQTAEDEAKVLADVCRRTRAKLHAAGVTVFSNASNTLTVVASDGNRVDPSIGERAMTAGVVIAPHQCEERIEAAAPVRYAGSTIGAVATRWPLGSPYSRANAPLVLELTAAAIAPALAVVSSRRATPPGSDLLGVSAAMRELRTAIERAAPAPFHILIEGESGSGKELVARALHRRSNRRDRPFCTLNCAALPEDLIESELFGHARGSFTGAIGDRPGVFEEAHTGTLLLDEVGELSLRAQAKLLRVIQEGELRRVGENMSRRVDVRLLAATNRDLRREAETGRFRTDLLYRLDVVRIVVPPLRDRREDISVLAEHYWAEATRRTGSRAVLGTASLAALVRYDWPGNVRELQNVLASMAVRVGKRGAVPLSALPPLFGAGATATSCRLDDARRTFDERFIRAALVRAGGRRTAAAAELGVTRQGLTKLMAKLGISDGG